MQAHRLIRPPLAGLVASIALLGAPVVATAFECATGDSGAVSLVWTEREVTWVLDRDVLRFAGNGASAEADARAAFDTWADVACSDLSFVYGGIVDGVVGEFNNGGENVNAVVWVSDNWPQDFSTALAVTTTSFNVATGEVLDTDIELNGDTFDFSSVELGCNPRSGLHDLRNTLTHEVGHFLGLDHPPETAEFAETTMFASAPPCETRKRSLAQDDINGICFIYPVAAPTQRCVVSADDVDGNDDGGCRHIDVDGSWPDISVAVVVVLLGLAVVRLRRRRP